MVQRRGRRRAGKGGGKLVEPTAQGDAPPEIGDNLRRLRTGRGLSLEKLAGMSGVSRAMLGQIELGRSTPTIKTLWLIARALDVAFSALLGEEEARGAQVMRVAEARRLTNHDGSFSSRALFPMSGPRRMELYELRLAPKAEEHAVAHAPGTVENLVVAQGKLEVALDGESYGLDKGDAIVFDADRPHVYRNPSMRPTVAYLAMGYAQPTEGMTPP